MKVPVKVATVGMFDGVHRGHRALLDRLIEESRRREGEAWVFTFGRHPLALIAPDRAPSPLMTADDKVAALKEAGVDGVEVLDFNESLRSLTAEEFLTMLRERYGVGVLVMGFNHRFGRDRVSDLGHYQEIGRRLGIEIVRAGELRDDKVGPVISSSSIREAVSEGDVKAAADMLGRRYALHGSVVGGRQLGRTIGFPTANLRLTSPEMAVPRRGVYAVDVMMPDGAVRRGIMNIGVRPTVDKDEHPQVSIEVHIIGWHGDLYGKELTVGFITRLRDERRFDSLEELKQQLATDKERALAGGEGSEI